MFKENFLVFLLGFVLLGSVSWAVSYGDLGQQKESELLWNQSMQILADLNNQLESQSRVLKTASRHSGVLDIELTREEAKSILERLKSDDIDSDEACDRLLEIIEIL